MTTYSVFGGTPLRGKVLLRGAKNAGFKAMIAALLANSPSEILDLGLISEIDFAKKVISSLGGSVKQLGDPHNLEIDPTNLSSPEISPELSSKSRFSIMYVGPLLARFGKAVLPTPGGDISIGKRPLNRHLEGLEALGAKINFNKSKGTYEFKAPNGLKGTTYRFEKNTHTGTEVMIIAAARAQGTTILENAAAEPEVDDLILYLNQLGAEIERLGPRIIKICGKDKLHGASHTVMKDRNEAVTFACGAIATNGSVEVIGADPKVLTAFLDKIKEIGAVGKVTGGGMLFKQGGSLKATNMETAPHPGFMTDWQPLWATLMTQAEGKSTIHETVYERRFDYIPALVRMGADIKLFQPAVTDPNEVYNFNLSDDRPENLHAIEIRGPTPLKGVEMEIEDIRSGATGLLAGSIASGVTVITDPKDQIKRGYEDLAGRLLSLGAKIKVQE